MQFFKGTHVYLRPVEREDATTIVIWENNVHNWRVTETETPYSHSMILEHIESSLNFRQSGTLRLMICLIEDDEPIGIIDLYDANFKHDRANIGILIGHQKYREKGYAFDALQILKRYATQILAFHNLTASILEDNKASVKLFEKVGFELVGVRKEWFKERDKRIDERIYQLCLRKEKEE